MKTVILCGGRGTRLSEETLLTPKPMVEIGDHPILWHIMKIYSHQGFKDFILALGYKGEVVKDYFLSYHPRTADVTIELATGKAHYTNVIAEDWTVQMVDTGLNTLTGGRVHRLENLLRPHGTFMLTYGDGLCPINLTALLNFHKQHGKLATVTAVRPPARFGTIVFNNDQVIHFQEKPQTEAGWINGGFFVFEPGIFDYLHGDTTVLEADPLENLARDGQLMGYKHHDFWHCVDTVRDRDYLREKWQQGQAPWKIWEENV